MLIQHPVMQLTFNRAGVFAVDGEGDHVPREVFHREPQRAVPLWRSRAQNDVGLL